MGNAFLGNGRTGDLTLILRQSRQPVSGGCANNSYTVMMHRPS